MAHININGRSYSGRSVNIINGKVFVNGVEADTADAKEVKIAINGPVESLQCDAANQIAVIGNVGTIKTQSGDVEVRGNVTGGIQTMSGDVEAKTIHGPVSTMSGDITGR